MTTQAPVILLKDDDVRRWYENCARSSILNAKVRLRRLNLFCHRIDKSPTDLVSIGRDNPMDMENILLDHVSWMETQNYAPGYTEGMIKTIKSWLEYNHIEIRRKIKVRNASIAVSIEDEQVPTQEQLEQILGAGSPRTKLIVGMMAFSGVRPQVMGTSDKGDGLKLSDLPELRIDGDRVSFEKTPAMIVVRAQLSKTKNKYFTFLTKQGCEYLLGYLRQRIAHGEILEPDSPLITFNNGYQDKGQRKESDAPFLTTPAISESIRRTIWGVMRIRPYALRAYFDTQMLMAESHGCMTHAYRQFFMGHKGDMEARYTTNKGRLTEQMTEDMRRAYAQSQTFLATDLKAGGGDKKDMLLNLWRQQAKMYGMDPASLIRDDSVMVPRERPASTIRDSPVTVPREIPAKADAPYESRIVEDEQSLLEHSAQGWEVDTELSDGRFLVRRATVRES